MSKLFFSFILNTTCHVTIRSVLNFVYSVAENLANGWAKVTLSMKLFKKISWIADQKVKNYLKLDFLIEVFIFRAL